MSGVEADGRPTGGLTRERRKERGMRRQLVVALAALAVLAAAKVGDAQEYVEYYHLDALGSVRVVTNEAGQVVSRHDYLPFGEEWNPQAFRDARLFTGKERDPETGMDYFGARYYRAEIGRFTTVDPVTPWQSAVANPQLWNRYAYALNNPLRYVDPDGRCIWDVCVAEGAGLYVVGAAAVATTAWLVSPSGQQAVRQVVNDTGAIITTAAGAIRSWFQTEKRPGTLGKPDHANTVEEEAARIAGTPEVRIDTPGGKKDSRRADAVGTNPTTGAPEIVQVYRPTPAGNVPKREKDAAADIERATGVKPTMVPVRPVPPKKPGEEGRQ
jgi:RHS repeat-associated protein